MPLTKEQLLIPRYMCTGTPGKPLWPGYHHKHGDIITNVRQVWINTMANEAPHLFHPLQWWEGRQPEDMPDWVNLGGMVFKVSRWDTSEAYKNGRPFAEIYGYRQIFDCKFLKPATEHEYNDYQKQKQ